MDRARASAPFVRRFKLSILQVIDGMVARGRFQLPTFALGVRCSMQLSYRALQLV